MLLYDHVQRITIHTDSRDRAIEYANSQQGLGLNNQQQWANDFFRAYILYLHGGL